MPATKTLVLLPGSTARASVFRHAGWSPARANWTKTDWAEDGGTLYRATSGLAVAATAAWAPVTREATASAVAVAVQVTRSPTSCGAGALGVSVTVPDGRARSSSASSTSRRAGRR